MEIGKSLFGIDQAGSRRLCRTSALEFRRAGGGATRLTYPDFNRCQAVFFAVSADRLMAAGLGASCR